MIKFYLWFVWVLGLVGMWWFWYGIEEEWFLYGSGVSPVPSFLWLFFLVLCLVACGLLVVYRKQKK